MLRVHVASATMIAARVVVPVSTMGPVRAVARGTVTIAITAAMIVATATITAATATTVMATTAAA